MLPLSSEQAGTFLRPDTEKVQNWVSKGASIILNDVNTVNSGIINISNELQNLTNEGVKGTYIFLCRAIKLWTPL